MALIRLNTDVLVRGSIFTDHDARWFNGQDFEGTAAYASEAAADGAPSHWDFDQTVVERIKWQHTPADGVLEYIVRMLWLNPGGGTGNVVWRLKQAQVNLGDNPTTAPATVSTITVPAPAVLGSTWRYDEFTTPLAVSTIDLGAGPIPAQQHLVIDRFASDAGDTCNGDVGLVRVSITRSSDPT